jgi:hypothetical protein
MSSFVECVERLFDDSGLEEALDAGQHVFDSGIDDELRTLSNLVDKIDVSQDPDQLINDSSLQLVRKKASEILRAINEKVPPVTP